MEVMAMPANDPMATFALLSAGFVVFALIVTLHLKYQEERLERIMWERRARRV
jgi:hypothetical protein